MTAALRAEFLKLRTTRLVAGMTGLAVALTALIGVLEARHRRHREGHGDPVAGHGRRAAR